MKSLPNIPTDTDVIMRWLLGIDKTNLNASQKLLLKRAQSCKDLVYEYGPDKTKIIKLHAKLQNISEETAKSDYENMLYFYNVQKESPRNFWIDFALSSITKNINEARKANDFATVSKENKNMIVLIEKFFGTEEKPDYSKLQPPDIILGFWPESTGIVLPEGRKLEVILKQLEMVKSESGFNVDDIEETEYEDTE